ncbi:MAG: hypothetical protein JWP89_6932 [Schlesneria sp.]|nr:hypothetical protein [Schlesneria sp.]
MKSAPLSGTTSRIFGRGCAHQVRHSSLGFSVSSAKQSTSAEKYAGCHRKNEQHWQRVVPQTYEDNHDPAGNHLPSRNCNKIEWPHRSYPITVDSQPHPVASGESSNTSQQPLSPRISSADTSWKPRLVRSTSTLETTGRRLTSNSPFTAKSRCR